MIGFNEIEADLVESDTFNPDYDFVAAAIQIDENRGEATHSGLIIKCKEEYLLLHFNGKLELEPLPQGDWYYHKVLTFIKPGIITSFLASCKSIKKNANPRYGYFFPGSLYDADGKYFSHQNMPEYMTCVGFCLNVLNYYVEEDQYIQYSDWGKEGISERFLNDIIEKFKLHIKDISLDKLIEEVRRIAPNEYLASAYIGNHPIRKIEIDKIIDNISDVIYYKAIPKLSK